MFTPRLLFFPNPQGGQWNSGHQQSRQQPDQGCHGSLPLSTADVESVCIVSSSFVLNDLLITEANWRNRDPCRWVLVPQNPWWWRSSLRSSLRSLSQPCWLGFGRRGHVRCSWRLICRQEARWTSRRSRRSGGDHDPLRPWWRQLQVKGQRLVSC